VRWLSMLSSRALISAVAERSACGRHENKHYQNFVCK
jgi:hypothetical protein